MPVGHTDSEEVLRYMHAAMVIARSCIYMPSAIIEQEKEFKSFTLALGSAAFQHELKKVVILLRLHFLVL
jgi:hypothetical protein